MDRLKQKLLVEQIDRKINKFRPLESEDIPAEGWIYAIRTALHMSLRQLGKRLGISLQGIKQLEIREKEQSITIKKLKEVGQALDMKFIYGFIPYDGSIENMIDKRAGELADNIVMRTSRTMELEDQKVIDSRLKEAIKNRKEEILAKMPRYLWD
ncbi:mobile mystery protein A [Bacteroidota bacterium]